MSFARCGSAVGALPGVQRRHPTPYPGTAASPTAWHSSLGFGPARKLPSPKVVCAEATCQLVASGRQPERNENRSCGEGAENRESLPLVLVGPLTRMERLTAEFGRRGRVDAVQAPNGNSSIGHGFSRVSPLVGASLLAQFPRCLRRGRGQRSLPSWRCLSTPSPRGQWICSFLPWMSDPRKCRIRLTPSPGQRRTPGLRCLLSSPGARAGAAPSRVSRRDDD